MDLLIITVTSIKIDRTEITVLHFYFVAIKFREIQLQQ